MVRVRVNVSELVEIIDKICEKAESAAKKYPEKIGEIESLLGDAIRAVQKLSPWAGALPFDVTQIQKLRSSLIVKLRGTLGRITPISGAKETIKELWKHVVRVGRIDTQLRRYRNKFNEIKKNLEKAPIDWGDWLRRHESFKDACNDFINAYSKVKDIFQAEDIKQFMGALDTYWSSIRVGDFHRALKKLLSSFNDVKTLPVGRTFSAYKIRYETQVKLGKMSEEEKNEKLKEIETYLGYAAALDKAFEDLLDLKKSLERVDEGLFNFIKLKQKLT